MGLDRHEIGRQDRQELPTEAPGEGGAGGEGVGLERVDGRAIHQDQRPFARRGALAGSSAATSSSVRPSP